MARSVRGCAWNLIEVYMWELIEKKSDCSDLLASWDCIRSDVHLVTAWGLVHSKTIETVNQNN